MNSSNIGTRKKTRKMIFEESHDASISSPKATHVTLMFLFSLLKAVLTIMVKLTATAKSTYSTVICIMKVITNSLLTIRLKVFTKPSTQRIYAVLTFCLRLVQRYESNGTHKTYDRMRRRRIAVTKIFIWMLLSVSFFSFFGVHPLRMTTTSSSTLKTQHEEEESMC